MAFKSSGIFFYEGVNERLLLAVVVPVDTCSAKCCRRRGGLEVGCGGQVVKHIPGKVFHEIFIESS